MNRLNIPLVAILILIINSVGVSQQKQQKPKSDVTFREADIEAELEWRPIGIYSGGEYTYVSFYNYKNLIRLDSTLKVWIKDRPFNAELSNARRQVIKERKGIEAPIKGYELYFYSLNLYEVDCKDRKTRLISIIDYDTNGRVLDNTDVDDVSKWENMVPSSVGNAKFSKICTNVKSN